MTRDAVKEIKNDDISTEAFLMSRTVLSAFRGKPKLELASNAEPREGKHPSSPPVFKRA